MDVNCILLGDCVDLLRGLPDASVDSIITDPPYGLGTKEPTPEEIDAYLKGASLDTGGDFMGTEWEIPSVTVWKECLRVLKPGGYVLSFASTRTWDIMSIGLRVAGFDNRDTISSLFGSPCLQWIHGQGFPKSMNIGKKLREMATEMAKKGGDEAEVARIREAAVRWEGFGTALKPAWEPILCFRKPTIEDSVLAQVLSTNTGGINIDGTRVKHASPEDFAKHKEHVERIKEKGGQWGDSWKNSSDLSGANDVTTAGRWPANVALTHSPECKVVGSRTVDAPVINRFTDGMKPFGDGAGHPYETVGGGEEDIPVYECAEGCPVRALDEQSGILTTGAMRAEVQRGKFGQHGRYGKAHGSGEGRAVEANSGGASRFFAQFIPDAPFYYTGKATKREKNEGVTKGKFHDGFVTLKEDLNDEQCLLLTEKWPQENPDPKSAIMEEAIPEELRELFTPVKPDDNKHPTVKPVALMRWLVRMVTPKGGVVLDPYCGSGTTCAAAVEEDVKFIGFDKDVMFHKLATKRVMYLHQRAEEHRYQRAAFDAMGDLPQE